MNNEKLLIHAYDISSKFLDCYTNTANKQEEEEFGAIVALMIFRIISCANVDLFNWCQNQHHIEALCPDDKDYVKDCPGPERMEQSILSGSTELRNLLEQLLNQGLRPDIEEAKYAIDEELVPSCNNLAEIEKAELVKEALNKFSYDELKKRLS